MRLLPPLAPTRSQAKVLLQEPCPMRVPFPRSQQALATLQES